MNSTAVNSMDLSMREKSMLKREINKQHNSNFKAGYVPINEPHLHKTGLRGRKSVIFYLIVILLFLIALLNLVVTLMMLSILKLGYGMQSMEFIPNGFLLKFLEKADLGRITISDGIVGSFSGQNMTIVGHNQAVKLVGSGDDPSHPSSLEVSPAGTVASNLKEFRVISHTTGKQIFSTKYPDFKIPSNTANLNVKQAQTQRVTSAIDSSLLVKSEYQIVMKGNEGTIIDGKNITLTAKQNVYLNSVNQSIIVDGKRGIYIAVDKIKKMTDPRPHHPYLYHLCVCMPSGRLFKMKVSRDDGSCNDADISGRNNPCL
ncbi:SGCB (predicted) [Pycnogonum litorale]